jgi:raffinose/stachyose/melibiose transport system substrate-binding protein
MGRRAAARVSTVLAVAALAFTAAACGGGDDEAADDAGATTAAAAGSTAAGATTAEDAAASGEPVTIRYLDEQAEDAPNEAAKKKEVDAFNKSHPNIKVERESLAPDDIVKVINARLGSNNPPDVFTYGTGAGFGGVLAKNGLISPIDDAYEKYGWKSYDWAKERGNYGGKVYAVPDQVEELGIYYNKQLFEEWGVEEPTTLEELEAIAEKAKENDIIPFAFGDKDQWPAGHQFSMTISNLLGRKGLDEILYGDGKWNSPEGVRAIDVFFKQFNEKGYFPRGVVGLGYDDANALFFSGRAAMNPTGTWLVNDITQKARFEAGFFPFPSIDGSEISPPAGVGAARFVAAKTKNREAALEFLNYLTTDEEVQKQKISFFNAIPAQPAETEGLEISPLFQEVLGDLAKAADDSDAFGYNIDVLTPQNFNQVMSQGFQDVLAGKRTPQQQADALQAAWEEAKAAGDILAKP